MHIARFFDLKNSRFYILSTAVLLSIFIACVCRVATPTDILYYIRVQQIFGGLSALYLYVALIISPLSYVYGKDVLRQLIHARRAIGVSAAYFALLHSSVAIFGQIGGINQLQYLPSLFIWSFVLGGFALVILVIMAATSFDVVIKIMTPKRWKLLHRLVYLSGLAIIAHVWSIATHMAYYGIQLVSFALIALLLGLEAIRITDRLAVRIKSLNSTDYYLTIFLTLWVSSLVLLASMPAFVDNYHSRHTGDENTLHTGADQ